MDYFYAIAAILKAQWWYAWTLQFILMIILDWAYAKYTIETAARNPHRASIFALILIVMTGLVTHGYIKDMWLLIPTALGAYLGTWIAVRTKA